MLQGQLAKRLSRDVKQRQASKQTTKYNVNGNIKYYEDKARESEAVISYAKKLISIANMRNEELDTARTSRFKPNSSLLNMFDEWIKHMPGKRENVQITIDVDAENIIGNKSTITPKKYGPFKMKVPRLNNKDMYKYIIYTLLQNNFSILSRQTISSVEVKIITHDEQFCKDHKAGALKLQSFFLDKKFPIKKCGDNTFMVDFVWHYCRLKKGFKKYTYEKLEEELSEYASSFPKMITQELVDWAKACHPNMSIHAYDATYRKFMKHKLTIRHHHCQLITDERLKTMAMKANQGGADNFWKYMSDMKWSRRHDQFTVLNDLDKEEERDVSNHVIVLPEDTKIEPVIDRYMIRTNYFVKYLHYENNGALHSFIDHNNNMYILNNKHDTRKSICDTLYKKYKTHDFRWSNQSYTAIATSVFNFCAVICRSHSIIIRQDKCEDFYPKALQWCSTNRQPQDLENIDISKCYPSILVDSKMPILVYTVHDMVEPFIGFTELQRNGEFYVDETVINCFGVPLKLEAGFYSRKT